MDATELLKGAIDIHIHIGPDPNRRRRVDGYQAAVQARDAGMRAVVFKSHDYNTTPFLEPFHEERDLLIFLSQTAERAERKKHAH